MGKFYRSSSRPEAAHRCDNLPPCARNARRSFRPPPEDPTMKKNQELRLAALIRKHEADILAEWLKAQLARQSRRERLWPGEGPDALGAGGISTCTS
jgi:hypothetical protein